MSAKPVTSSAGVRRHQNSKRAIGGQMLGTALIVAVATLSGCRKNMNLSPQSIESERFLDHYAAGRGLTREQARDEVMAKMREQEQQSATTAVEDNGVIYR